MIKSKNLILGICAHVDAGKTTLSEGLLYLGGSIRKMGRVDTGDAFLDTDEMERARGITIFSKQAQFSATLADGTRREYTLLDTPGHADFSPEMERTLQVLDLAILVISSADGVNAQVKTLWSLLRHYHVPTFLYVNKMDQMENLGEGDAKREELLAEIQENLNANALQLAPYASRSDGQRDDFCHAPGGDEFSHPMPANGESERSFASLRMTGEIRSRLLTYLSGADLQESLALCDEDLLNRYMEGEPVGPADIEMLVAERKLFPVFFGSALKMQGVEELLEGLNLYSPTPAYPEEFSARVFKITRDGRDRLTWMKVTGGSIAVRKELTYIGRKSGEAAGSGDGDGEAFAEKITQIRLYSGDKFAPLPEANAGCVCAVCGLTATYAGQGLGANATENAGLIVPVLTWQILLPQGVDPFKAYRDLCVLEEEEPMLQVAYNERKGEITACVMGEIQRDVLKKIVKDRFDLEIAFGRPQVMYRETIAAPVEGVGHFEPLRHYAEVHLLLEPGEPGSGLVFDSKCSVDSLARNWQRLVLTHLRERRHKGVLTGSEITDMKITLIGGRAHEKHTEGGDFRQATYRAVRQGLMMARNVLLEPYYNFRIELPQGNLGRALTDLQQMGASFGPPDIDGDEAILTGSAPVSELGDYAEKLG
ncbi:MAG: TetM/TetW/TetO/TetS family tetracycline resistance ribosomal protection protein, partial [Lachnospiraceae bacterium]|nr:TetM/TetW/TetO/TetS family tetracycline resistance ribosomal protection protein [Lachnospiraceae bacterium]